MDESCGAVAEGLSETQVMGSSPAVALMYVIIIIMLITASHGVAAYLLLLLLKLVFTTLTSRISFSTREYRKSRQGEARQKKVNSLLLRIIH